MGKDNSAIKQLLEQNVEKRFVYEPELLILAETMADHIFTNSQILGYTHYSVLNSYNEDFEIVRTQNLGKRGVNVSNLLLNIPNDGVSVYFSSAFFDKTILKRVEIVKIGTSNHKEPVLEERISYGHCRIEQYTNLNHSVQLSIRYTSREDLYMQYENGRKHGRIVSRFSSV